MVQGAWQSGVDQGMTYLPRKAIDHASHLIERYVEGGGGGG